MSSNIRVSPEMYILYLEEKDVFVLTVEEPDDGGGGNEVGVARE